MKTIGDVYKGIASSPAPEDYRFADLLEPVRLVNAVNNILFSFEAAPAVAGGDRLAVRFTDETGSIQFDLARTAFHRQVYFKINSEQPELGNLEGYVFSFLGGRGQREEAGFAKGAFALTGVSDGLSVPEERALSAEGLVELNDFAVPLVRKTKDLEPVHKQTPRLALPLEPTCLPNGSVAGRVQRLIPVSQHRSADPLEMQ